MPNATETGCAILLGDPAVNMVATAYDKYTQFASQAYSLASSQVGDLKAFDVQPLNFGVSFNVGDAVMGYVRPTKPVTPAGLTFREQGEIPDSPSLSVPAPSFDAAPAAPNNPTPTLREFAEPGGLTAVAPDSSITLQAVPVAVRPDYQLPDVPTLAQLDLPATPTINLPEFQGQRPNTDLDVPDESFTYTPPDYTSALLDKVTARTSIMLDGGTGLPAAVEQALRDRAYSALDVQEYRAVQQATDEFATRGFAEPTGVLNRKLSEVRQNNQNQRSGLSRDIYIKAEEETLQNLRFAVTQGQQLEVSLFGAHNEQARIGLDAAQTTQTMRIRIFEAKVSLAQLGLSAYQTDAQVWRDQLQGELSKLELYRTQLQALQTKGELNMQQVQLYEGQLRGVAQLADLYRTDIEASKLVVAQNQQQLDIERTEIQNYVERVNAYRAEWETYATKLGTNTNRANVYQMVEQGFSTRLRGWGDAQQQKIAQATLGVSLAELDQRSWRGKVDTYLAKLQAETSRINSVSEVYRTNVAAYSAEASVETAASDANLRALTMATERERSRTDVALKQAEIAINQLVEISRLMLAKEQAVAQTSSQLAASSMSAVNFSAGIHSGRSQSQGCSTSFNYSGNLDDTPAP